MKEPITAPIVNSVGDGLKRWIVALIALSGVSVVGWFGETGLDGGAIKELWAQAKIASPFGNMLLLVVVSVVWSAWQKDREMHRIRTDQFVAIMNRAARLREREQNIFKIALEKRAGRRA